MKTLIRNLSSGLEFSEFDDEKEQALLDLYKNDDCFITTEKPSQYHEFDWETKQWIDKEAEYKLANYAPLRANEYPPMSDYIDAQVKKSSVDPAMQEAGLLQEQEYLAKCLQIKATYPKP